MGEKTQAFVKKMERLLELKVEENTLLQEIIELIPPMAGETAVEALTDPRLPAALRYRRPEGS